MALNRDGHRYEIVNGELIDMGNSGAKHGYVCSILMILLGGYVHIQKLGAMFDSSTAFKMKSGNKRSPDVSFMAKERLQGLDDIPDGFLEGAPDLAVEILSPSNTVAEIHDKLVEYFENGSRLVWVINPKEKYVLVYRSSQEPDRLLKSTDSLDGEEIVSGFTLPVAELFQKLGFLLRDAIIRTLEAAEIATIREIIVQAISKNFVKLISGK
ncbi:MAG: Uma2 family endonuclease [Oscillatoriales cyanobacterium]|nr:MAG: Uma2 family endonuclease [Oscillatoriales cyanobacterium]